MAIAFLTVNEDKKGVVGAYEVGDGDEHSLDDEPEETEGWPDAAESSADKPPVVPKE